jgi:leucyl aminopeptidase
LDSGLRFRRTVHFAFYAAEEVGLVGSQAVVSSFSSRKIPVRAALQFDMVGYNSPNDSLPIYMIGDNTHPGLTQFVRDLAKEYLGIAQTGTTLCDYACSDHARWYQAGIPVAFPFESSFENSNNQIHTAGDTVARLDWDHVMNFVKLGLAFAIELGEPTNPDTCFLCRFSK